MTSQTKTSTSHKEQSNRSSGIEQNIGKIDRYIRLTAGLFLVGSALSARRQTLGSRTLLTIGSMSVAEGVLGWCPMMHLFGIQNTDGAIGIRQASQQGKRTDGESQHDKGSSAEATEARAKKEPSEGTDSSHESSPQMASTEGASSAHEDQNDGPTADINTSFQ